MSENDNAQRAQFKAMGVHEWQGEEGSTDATNLAAIIDAQVEATLAVAYEQRTANLIALYSIDNLTEVPYGLVLKQIKERLGL